MLSITKPINPSLRSDFVHTGMGFSARIRGNYEQIPLAMFPEDLMHLVTQPPDVFVVGGEGGGGIFAETNIENRQIQKVQVINNMINRILVSADTSMTYQDRIFVTNILKKLGIRDEKVFMEQVYSLMEETKQTNNLLRAYETNHEQLTNLVREYKSTREGDEYTHVEQTSTDVEQLHLHEVVNERWHAGDDLTVMNSFRQALSSSTSVTQNEYAMAQQSTYFDLSRLQEFRNMIRGEQMSLIYREENVYEQPDAGVEEITEARVEEKINGALLVNMISNLYRSVSPRMEKREEKWFQTDSTFYRAGDVTLRRLEQGSTFLQNRYERDQIFVDTDKSLRQENALIQNILKEFSQEERTDVSTEVSEQNIFEEAELTMPAPEEKAEEPPAVDVRNTLEQQLYQLNIQNQQRQREYVQNLQQLVNEYEQPGVRPNPVEIRRESLLALEHPEEFARQKVEQARIEEEREREFQEKAEQLLPKETREIFSAVREYLNGEPPRAGAPNITVNNESLLYYDSLEPEQQERIMMMDSESPMPDAGPQILEAVQRQARGDGTVSLPGLEIPEEMIHRVSESEFFEEIVRENREELQRETEQNVSETVRERILSEDRYIREAARRQENETRRNEEEQLRTETVNLIHKSQETSIDDETIETLREEIRRVESDNRRVQETVTNNTVVEDRVINNTTQQTITQDNEQQIRDIVGRSIRGQIDDLSDRVYSKIERQLESERRRRGL